MQYDVFNGDADGICALQQWRLASPYPAMEKAQLITGVKRDIRLLDQLTDVENAQITVFDISLDSNRDALETLLINNNSVHYIDHHFTGDIPTHPLFASTINTDADTCTSLIVNDILQGAHALWAICGAYGDNLHGPVATLAASLSLSKGEQAVLCEIGELLNYNGYGAQLEDLHYHPAELLRAISAFANPFDFYNKSEVLQKLRAGYRDDMRQAAAISPHQYGGRHRIYFFPDAPWARRVSGVFSNERAREQRDLAHAVITQNNDGTLRISLRAPLNKCEGADLICKSFPTGGGRKAAAGINALPSHMLPLFLEKIDSFYA